MHMQFAPKQARMRPNMNDVCVMYTRNYVKHRS
jgi:hypothetical protein